MNCLFTLNEVALLERISYEAVKKKVQRNNLKALKVDVESRKGFEYRVSFESLSPAAKRRYLLSHSSEDNRNLYNSNNTHLSEITWDSLTARQRNQVYQWRQVLSEYGEFIGEHWKQRTEMTKVFVEQIKNKYPDLTISTNTIYKYQRLYREYGEAALCDRRSFGNRLNKSNIMIAEIKAMFETYWLDESRPTVTSVRNLINTYAEENNPEWLPLPSLQTFFRLSNSIEKPIIEYFRYGNKSFEDKCLPYVERDYSKLESNDIWESDYHTLDFWVRDDNTNETFRPHLIVWIDVRSRKVMSYGLYKSSGSDGTIMTFRRAITKYGIPRSVYLDNGREFLTSDFGGRGRRKTDINSDYGYTILERLGVTMHNAKVANGKAKLVERYFKGVKDNFSRYISTYTGGKPEERPERLKTLLEDKSNIPLLSKVNELLGLYIEGSYNNERKNAKGLNGMTPNECYSNYLITKRSATKSDLELMLLRTARLQKVARNGVKLKINGGEVWYYNEELARNWQGKSVYVRYNPEELSSVRVYNDKEQFITEAVLKAQGGYDFGSGADIEAIKINNEECKKIKKAVKTYKEKLANIIEAPEATELIEIAAKKRINNDTNIYNAPILEPVRYEEERAEAVGENRLTAGEYFGNLMKKRGF